MPELQTRKTTLIAFTVWALMPRAVTNDFVQLVRFVLSSNIGGKKAFAVQKAWRLLGCNDRDNAVLGLQCRLGKHCLLLAKI